MIHEGLEFIGEFTRHNHGDMRTHCSMQPCIQPGLASRVRLATHDQVAQRYIHELPISHGHELWPAVMCARSNMEFIGEFSVSPDDLKAYRERSFVPSKNSVGVLAGIEARLSHPL